MGEHRGREITFIVVDRSKIGSGDIFKLQEEIRVPDVRWKGHLAEEHILKEFYNLISDVKLSERVPNDVFINFETGKNTLLYSYFSYRMSMPALSFAFATLELAITYKAQLHGKQKI